MQTMTVQANGLELASDVFGRPGTTPVVLVMGLGTPRIAWPDELCEDLTAGRRQVIRFDNRDVGESTHLDDLADPSVFDVLLRRRAPYTVDDMADDLIGLLDTLNIAEAHVVGASLGGFIAQAAAIRHPHRVRTLSVIMSSTGSRLTGLPAPRLAWRLATQRPATDRDAAIQQRVDTFRLIGSPGFPFDEAWTRELATLAWERGGSNPNAFLRQLAAVLAQRNRTAALRALESPTLVIHGLHDRLVRPSGGIAIARAVPRSRFIGFSGMGHDLPRALWPAIVEEITEHTDDHIAVRPARKVS